MKVKWKNYFFVTVLLIAFLTPLLIHIHKLLVIESSWYQKDIPFKQTSLESSRETLNKLSIDTALPGNGNNSLSFIAPFGLVYEDTAYNEHSFIRGDQLQCDFVSWSHSFFRQRMVMIYVNGQKTSAKISTSQLSRLYLSALKQNGLEAQFQEDSGKRLNYFSAKSAISRLDQTLFDEGIHRAYNYPYDRQMVKIIIALSLILLVPICLLFTAALSIACDTARYQLWLKKYNAEKEVQWDKIAGTLPQFVSLKESCQDTPLPEFQKPKLTDKILDIFKPERFRK